MHVLFVCTANVCRSREAEEVFRELTARDGAGHAVRSAGTAAGATGRQLTEADLAWADVVCVMERAHHAYIAGRWRAAVSKVRVLGIPDDHAPGDPILRDSLATHILALLAEWGSAAPPAE